MADKTPLKATYSGSDTNGLAEFINTDTVAVAHGGTGASTASQARTNLGITDTTPAGSNTQVQYNNSGAFGASGNLTFDGSALTVTGTADVSGDFTAGTVNADGDTSAGDNAAMGYTAAEGLILTGQGSTSDVTIKNDADATVLSVPTGTTNVGIGTTAAIQPLHVVTSSGANVLFQLNNDAGENTYAARRSRGSEGSPTAIQTDDTILAVGAEGYDGSTYAGRAQLKILAAENWSGSARGTKFAFYGATTGQGGLDSDPWVMITNGSMGVGNNSAYSGGSADPAGAPPTGSTNCKVLKMDGGLNVDAALQISGYSDIHGLDIWTDVSTGDVYFDQRGDHDDYDMRFRTKTTGTPIDAMWISGYGQVRMNTTDDYGQLEIGTADGNGGVRCLQSTNGQALMGYGTATNYAGQAILGIVGSNYSSSAFSFVGQDYQGANTHMKIRTDGHGYIDQSWNGGGADYAEYWESTDGARLDVGKTVVLDGNKVRYYNAEIDTVDDIFGVIRPRTDEGGSAGVIGNAQWSYWNGRYKTDDFGRWIKGDRVRLEWYDPDNPNNNRLAAEGKYSYYEDEIPEGVTPPEDAVRTVEHVRIPNDDFDPTLEYIPREDRDEWQVIGLIGQIPILATETVNPKWKKQRAISDATDEYYVS